MNKKVTKEEIDAFLSGHNPMEKIIKIEMDYDDDHVHVFYRDEKGIKKCQVEPFYPFVWSKQVAARNLFNGDRRLLKQKMTEYGIACKGLEIANFFDGSVHPRMENGYRVLFFAKMPMSFSKFMQFFIEGKRPIYPRTNDKNYGLKDYIVVAPNEQHMISTGKRLFKGYNDYDDTLRVLWDLETEGLNPETDMISQIGIRTNKGYEKIIKIDGKTREEKSINEIKGLKEMFTITSEIDPDVISGHNTENFDWNFIDVRLQKHNSSLVEFTSKFFNGIGIYKKKKQSVLKLGGEMEYYYPTIKYGTNITDSLHAVRRAQAIDSSMKKADLKYVTKYSKLNKPNRVYVPGKIINTTWSDSQLNYAHNDVNGHWFKIDWNKVDRNRNFNDINSDPSKRYYTLQNEGKEILIDSTNQENFDIVTGTYIVERYLLDDLYETDKVELRYNQPNFLVGKMLPVAFDKMCTMGTAAIWKYIMLAWSYEKGLAIPELIETRKFTGGLSRLLSVGFVDRIVKLDYNSLYPSIILSYDIKSPIDISGVMNALLEYILTQREHYKELKGYYGKLAKELSIILTNEYSEENEKKLKQYESEVSKNDKLQLPLKITGNGFFGSYGSGSVFPHSDIECAEMTTCIGRMCLRLMISHFTKLGYKPIVGDSFTGDTPLFLKYKDSGLIDIKTIQEIIDEKEINIDALGREYDYSEKPYKVLSRNGWQEVKYVYRHKTNKDIYEITDNDTVIEVTEDHSLFDNNQNKIKPSEITSKTRLEYYNGDSINSNWYHMEKMCIDIEISTFNSGNMNKVSIELLNSDIETKKYFIKGIDLNKLSLKYCNKKTLAGIRYIIRCIN